MVKNNTIDVNCDMGESFGSWKMGNDEAIMPFISSANIACGYHAGDATTMRQTAQLAIKYQVKIGAHPGFPDLQGFGRRSMQLSANEVYDCCVYQIGALLGTVSALGATLHHVKPHGALYNMAAQNKPYAAAIAKAVYDINPHLILYGLSGSFLISEAEKIGLKTASEVFADRTYQTDGSLTPRNEPHALIHSTEEALKQVETFIEKQQVYTVQGEWIRIKADTVCIHGDGVAAVDFAKAISSLMKN